VTTEARLGFLLFFFLCWTVVGLMPWAIATVANRGRGAEWALPVAVVAAWAGGVLVPAVGLRDSAGFVISLFVAMAASAAGSYGAVAVWRRMEAEKTAKAGDAASETTPAPVQQEAPLDRPAPPSLD
jgi:cytochrome c-type biogenesis protein CcmH/NrfG